MGAVGGLWKKTVEISTGHLNPQTIAADAITTYI